jgi:hypothetical protein
VNSETAIVVAVVIAITIVLSVSLFFNTSLDRVGQSLLGENSDEPGFFTPEESDDGGYEFPTQGDQNDGTDQSTGDG